LHPAYSAAIYSVSIAGAFKQILLVDFYVHLKFQGAPVFSRDLVMEKNTPDWIETITKRRTDYFIWDEQSMGDIENGWISTGAVSPVQEWRPEKSGKRVLYRITS